MIIDTLKGYLTSNHQQPKMPDMYIYIHIQKHNWMHGIWKEVIFKSQFNNNLWIMFLWEFNEGEILWEWMERNEKMSSLFLLMPLRGRLFAGLVYWTTTYKEQHNLLRWVGVEGETSGVPRVKNLHLVVVTVLESHLQDRAPWCIRETPMDTFSHW